MDIKDMIIHVDHTQLKAFATWEDIVKLCDEAVLYKTASVCIPPCYVKRVRKSYPKLNICTVIGFPLGYSVTSAKMEETKQAVLDGADEIDMVINISDVKNGDFDKVKQEIQMIKSVCDGRILKVIIETCYLNEQEKTAMCHAVTDAGADYIKTSTGFGTEGARLEDIRLFQENIGSSVKIKAAGGIRTKEAMESFLEAGCERIGCSAAADLMKQNK